jgi:hypothetical protein
MAVENLRRPQLRVRAYTKHRDNCWEVDAMHVILSALFLPMRTRIFVSGRRLPFDALKGCLISISYYTSQKSPFHFSPNHDNMTT